uniref:Transmembrane protein n=1 Tax=Angiostrongylus cantonensis TaxID=6313 RepID=A0A158P617_ANGCA
MLSLSELNLIKELSSSCGLFDKTQWERTRFSSEVAVDEKYFTEIFKQPLEPEESIRRRLVLLSESKQSTVVRGEYLNEKPKFTITLLSVEVVWCAACALVWAAAAVNPIVPLVTAALNMLIMFLLILSCLSIEICEVHVARAVLLCANITVMVFDDDFDIASIIVLAATPLQLILVAIHIFLSLKPKYQ